MSIWAKRWLAFEHPAEAIHLVEAIAQRPKYFAWPYPIETARQWATEIVGSPIVWATYNGEQLTGAVSLTRIQWPNDALIHFIFLDRNLVAKRKLLNNILGVCFEEYQLNRLSMEVPEGIRLERFARSVLRFRYEGENRPLNPELPPGLDGKWVAKQGSRIEQGFFDGTGWSDVIRLRLLASEWVGTGGADDSSSGRRSIGGGRD